MYVIMDSRQYGIVAVAEPWDDASLEKDLAGENNAEASPWLRWSAAAAGVLWRFLNSAFALWLLSSVVITLAVGFASEERSCVTAVKSAIPMLMKAASERDQRAFAIVLAVAGPKSLDEVNAKIRSLITGADFFYADFKGKTLSDLDFQLVTAQLDLFDSGMLDDKDVYGFLAKETYDLIRRLKVGALEQKDLDGLRNALPTEWQYFQLHEGDFPLLNEASRHRVDDIVNRSPCQPLGIIRDRLSMFLHGPG
jgi:hypothetical protein